jgi:hypothetical protein
MSEAKNRGERYAGRLFTDITKAETERTRQTTMSAAEWIDFLETKEFPLERVVSSLEEDAESAFILNHHQASKLSKTRKCKQKYEPNITT